MLACVKACRQSDSIRVKRAPLPRSGRAEAHAHSHADVEADAEVGLNHLSQIIT